MITILGVFDDPITARRAMDMLRDSPIPLDDISIVSRATDSGAAVGNDDDVSAGEGAAVGAVWGGLVGLAALLIPGIGPFIAGGALFAALTGAATGAVVGGIAAALIDFSGVPAEEARRYESLVHEGKTLIAVKARDEDAVEVRRLLADAGAGSIREDESAPGIGRSEVAMYDEAGNRVMQERAFGTGGAAASPTTTSTTTTTIPGTGRGETVYGTPGIYDVPETTGVSVPPAPVPDTNLTDPQDPRRRI